MRGHIPRARVQRFGHRPVGETTIERIERISEAYGLVLLLVLATFVVTVTLPPEGWLGRVGAVTCSVLTAIVALSSSNVRPERVRGATLVGVVAIALAVLARLLDAQALLGTAFIIVAIMLTVAAATILRSVVGAADVEFRTILGAISVFTMLGLLFGYVFLAIGRIAGTDEVFTGVANASAQDSLFFSYTTLTTTGYGNLVPSGQIGQIIAVLEMLTGQIFLVTLVAGLVSLWRPTTARDRDREEADDVRRD